MIREIRRTIDRIEVILYDGTSLVFSAHYSEIEDCINLLLVKDSVNNRTIYTVKDVFVGATDDAYKFLELIKEN